MKFYQDAKGEWRWTLKADNGEIIGASSEGYKQKSDCVKNAEDVCDALGEWMVERDEGITVG